MELLVYLANPTRPAPIVGTERLTHLTSYYNDIGAFAKQITPRLVFSEMQLIVVAFE